MKTLAFLLATLLLAQTSVRADSWKKVWSDEFDYQGLPDKTKWNFEEGFVRNQEAQYYTRERLENARVENGVLVIECRRDHFKPKNHSQVEYTSASLTTVNRADWRYGRIEVSAKLPTGRGVWPAIWTKGTSYPKVRWPACGEIDIMEFVGNKPNHIYGTLHYPPQGGRDGMDQGDLATDTSNGFNTYAVEWDADHIDFFLNDRKYHTVMIDKAGIGENNPFRKAHFLILNFALGGSWGGPIDNAVLPQQLLVDYVRVFQRNAP